MGTKPPSGVFPFPLPTHLRPPEPYGGPPCLPCSLKPPEQKVVLCSTVTNLLLLFFFWKMFSPSFVQFLSSPSSQPSTSFESYAVPQFSGPPLPAAPPIQFSPGFLVSPNTSPIRPPSFLVRFPSHLPKVSSKRFLSFSSPPHFPPTLFADFSPNPFHFPLSFVFPPPLLLLTNYYL